MENAEVERLVGELEIGIDRLRGLYEQYFMGFEKMVPSVPHKDVERRIYVLRKEQIRNTALRYRFQMVVQRYNTYQAQWQRVLREIENGTYKRHVIKALKRFGQDGAGSAAKLRKVIAGARDLQTDPSDLSPELLEEDIDVELDDDAPTLRPPPRRTRPPSAKPAAAAPVVATPPAPGPSPPGRPGAPPAPALEPVPPASPLRMPAAPRIAAAGAPASPPPATASGPRTDLPDERVRQLYRQYVETKRQQNESTAAITFESVAKSIRDSGAKLREKHGKAVDFEVAVKDGKTILKPVLK